MCGVSVVYDMECGGGGGVYGVTVLYWHLGCYCISIPPLTHILCAACRVLLY